MKKMTTININPTDDLVLYKEEFINSRIEKFLYAICALDFDDLPTPLSRIEELYKCLATGLPAPTFVPQSRVEKYLMAILGAYDASALPAPKSRTEVLLNKILLGDTDLSDIEWLKSRYEFLLAYIIKAGGFNGGSPDDPIYYVNYPINSSVTTLYNTVEYPVKNAVLSGNTLVNLVDFETNTVRSAGTIVAKQGNKITFTTSTTGKFNLGCTLPTLKPNTKYLLKIKAESSLSADVSFNILNVTTNAYIISNTTITDITHFFTTKDTVDDIKLSFYRATSVGDDTVSGEAVICEYQEGMENWDIPFFTGMQSVKMPVLTTTGKNLFYNTLEYGDFNNSTGLVHNNSKSIIRTKDYNEITPNKTYRITVFNAPATLSTFQVYEYDNGFNYIKKTDSNVVTTDVNTKYVKFRFRKSNNAEFTEEELTVLSCMITEGDTIPDTYEPYKSTTVSCNEEFKLCRIGDIKDELNLVTGELTQRVGVITLDGSADEGWSLLRKDSITNVFQIPISLNIKLRSDLLSNLFDGKYIETIQDGVEVIKFNNSKIYVNILNTKATSLEDFKNYITQHPLTIQYELATESVKTVDLSTLDQDGKETELSTFDDITHVTVSSEGLVPTGDIDIARPIQFVDYSLDNGLTTLYNTIEYPVKSAILRGQTLVNLPNKLTTELSNSERRNDYKLDSPLTAGKKYLICFNGTVENGGDLKVGALVNNSTWGSETVTWVNGHNKVIIIISTNSDYIRISSSLTKVTTSEVMIIEYQDGMENWDIPYFEGMQSVKMPVLTTTGKNLFNKNNIIVDGYIISNGNLVYETGDNRNASDFIEVEPNCIYRISGIKNSAINGARSHQYVGMYDKNKKFISSTTIYCLGDSETFTTTENTKYIRISVRNDDINRLQIEKGTTATTYEPYKSNILTCNEEVELRGIGDIKDELNLVTGELTQRVGEIVLDGSEEWVLSAYVNSTSFYTPLNNLVRKVDYLNSMSCDKLVVHTNESYLFNSTSPNGISAYADWAGTYPNENWIYIKYADSEGYVEKLKQWLSQNPITVQYELAAESVKTVDLSTLDQDGKETELNTVDDITHVIVSSEGLVPTGEITVATKNATDVADASAMSLRMDDILNSQNTLEGSANAQSDDINVTMLGATDIYEQLL